MKTTSLPLARHDDLNIQTLAGELLVYDRRTDKAYVLSPSAAAVWRACNGERSVKQIADSLSRQTPTTEQAVWYALSQLNELLVKPVTIPNEFAGLSRRQFLKRTGLIAGAAAVPVVVSIVAPPSAHAQSVTQVCCRCVNYTSVFGNCDQCDFICSGAGGLVSCMVESPCP